MVNVRSVEVDAQPPTMSLGNVTRVGPVSPAPVLRRFDLGPDAVAEALGGGVEGKRTFTAVEGRRPRVGDTGLAYGGPRPEEVRAPPRRRWRSAWIPRFWPRRRAAAGSPGTGAPGGRGGFRA